MDAIQVLGLHVPQNQPKKYRERLLTINDLSDRELRARYRFGRAGLEFITDIVRANIKHPTKRSKALSPEMQVFRLVEKKFNCLHSGVRVNPEKTCTMIMACAVLHNIAIDLREPMDDADEVDDSCIDIPFRGPEKGRTYYAKETRRLVRKYPAIWGNWHKGNLQAHRFGTQKRDHHRLRYGSIDRPLHVILPTAFISDNDDSGNHVEDIIEINGKHKNNKVKKHARKTGGGPPATLVDQESQHILVIEMMKDTASFVGLTGEESPVDDGTLIFYLRIIDKRFTFQL
ncbi:HARBI1 [Mytilus coruscus]|uniref:HARBI1 n=1 Tax=Mytilus coruscus TaxID=42192 RepID=A0A6J8DEI7_MYTCO|nr:HARBI1 [Mytilus coruscus]